MKRPVAFYMLLIMASIFLFFFLNLVLGSVSIPLRAVWNILWGTGNESVIWQNIIWKSRVPQALTALVAGAGLSVSGLQMQTVFRNPLAGPSVLGISSGASMGVAFVVLLSGSLGGVALSKLGFMGNSPYHSSYCRFTFHYGTYCFRFPKSKGQCYFADYRCDDWLHSQCGDRCAEIFSVWRRIFVHMSFGGWEVLPVYREIR